jgi:DNA-directed RNA polymerase sigma subunit (sigma70/sigma32)
MHAVKKFDCARGNQFSTYASWWIKQNIRRAIVDEGKTIRIPQSQLELRKKVWRFADDFAASTNVHPTIDEIAKGIGISTKRVARCIRFDPSGIVLSGDVIDRDWQERERSGGVLILNNEETERAKAMLRRERQLYRDYPLALTCLRVAAEKRNLLERYLGLNGNPPCGNLKAIADDVGLTRERMRQIANEVADAMSLIHEVWWDYKWYLGHDARTEALQCAIG